MAVDVRNLRMDGISFGYDGHPPIFEDFSLQLPQDELVWLKAPQGAGKAVFSKSSWAF